MFNSGDTFKISLIFFTEMCTKWFVKMCAKFWENILTYF